MAQLSTNIIKIALCSLTYQKLPKSSCKKYMYILIQKIKNRNENILFITSINIKHPSKYKLSYTFLFQTPNLGRKLNEMIQILHKNYLNDKNII